MRQAAGPTRNNNRSQASPHAEFPLSQRSMADPYAYEGDAGGAGGLAGLGPLCARLAEGRGSKSALARDLKQLWSLLEGAPQDVDALGRAKAELPPTISDLLAATDKDVRLYLALCIVQMLRIWAPEVPWEDAERVEVRRAPPAPRLRMRARDSRGRDPRLRLAAARPTRIAPHPDTRATWQRLRGAGSHSARTATPHPPLATARRPGPQAALQAVLWVVARLQNHAAPSFQMALSVLQVFCEVRPGPGWRGGAGRGAGGCGCAGRARRRGTSAAGPAPPHKEAAAPARRTRMRAPCNAARPLHGTIAHAAPQTKTYYLLCDSRDEVEMEWFRALLDCITCAIRVHMRASRRLALASRMHAAACSASPCTQRIASCALTRRPRCCASAVPPSSGRATPTPWRST